MVLRMASPIKVRGSRFPYARKVVPKPLRGILGRSEFKRPLHGATDGEVRRQQAEALAEWETEIGAARDKLAGNLRTLTAREIATVGADLYRAKVAEIGDDPGDPAVWSLEIDRLMDWSQHEPDEEPPEYEPDAKALAEADGILRRQGIAADAASIRRTARTILETRVRIAGEMIRRGEGDWSPDPYLRRLPEPAPLTPAGPPKATEAPLTFTALVAAWAAETQPPQKTVDKWLATFAGFAEVIGRDTAATVTTADVRKWKEHRFTQGRSAKTVADGVAVMRATWNWGSRNGLLPRENPFAGMAPKVTKRGPAARQGFTDAQAVAVLSAARRETGWLRWLPWLLAFTGLRIEEAAEARKQDVRREAGAYIIDVVPTAQRALKTAQSQRMVPLHPALVAEGFVSYAEALPAGPLFPDLRPGRYGSRGSTATKTHSRWVRGTVGLTDKTLAPAHSWRHRLEDQLRIARVPAEAQDAITGHENPRNAGAEYGRGFRGMPDELLKEIRRIPSPMAPLPAPAGSHAQAGTDATPDTQDPSLIDKLRARRLQRAERGIGGGRRIRRTPPPPE